MINETHFLRKNVPKGMYAPSLSHIHDDKIALSNNISSERIGPFGLIFHIKHLSKGGIKVCGFMQIHYSRWPPCPYMVKTLSISSQELLKGFGPNLA